MKHNFLVVFAFLYSQFLFSQSFVENSKTVFENVYVANSKWIDYDNDGDLDLFLTGYKGSSVYFAKLYNNNGDGSFADSNIAFPQIPAANFSWGDYNNDGKIDLYIAGKDLNGVLSFWLYKNNGDGTFTSQDNTGLIAVFQGESNWGDYNNDGFDDLLINGRPTSDLYSETYLFKNNGNGTFTKQTGIVLSPNLTSAKWIDYNNDGFLDISISGANPDDGYSRATYLYKNNGNNTFSLVSTIPNYGGDVSWGDYDKDNDLDMLISGCYSANTQFSSYVYRNDGNAVFTLQNSIALAAIAGHGAWADIDNDGDLDVTLSGSTQTSQGVTKVYSNNGSGVFSEITTIPFVQLYYSYFNYVDIDNDGDLDFFQTGYNGSTPVTKLFNNISRQIIANNVFEIKGQTFDLPISTSVLYSSDSIISYQFKVAYDATKLQYTGNTITGTIAAGGSTVVNTVSSGILIVSYMNSNSISGAGNILKLQFKALDFDTTYVNLSDFYYNTTPITNLKNSVVIIADTVAPRANIKFSQTTGKLRFADSLLITATFTEPMRTSPLPQISLGGIVTVAATDMKMVNDSMFTFKYGIPKANGNVTISLGKGKDIYGNTLISTPLTNKTFTILPLVYGDVDDNGQIMAYDAALTLQYSVGKSPVGIPLPWVAWRKATANVDNVGDITANDAALILKYSATLINTFPASGTKSATAGNADVSITLENNSLVFRSIGELYGLNVFVDDNNQVLDKPVIYNDSMISAVNIGSGKYAIGLATAFAPKENSVFMKIPVKSTKAGIVNFNLIVNTQSVLKSVKIATAIQSIETDGLLVYPNPVKNELTIVLPENNYNGIAQIFSIEGKLLLTQKLTSNESTINVGNITNGMYTVKLSTLANSYTQTFIKK
jgi:hypothetical protein